MLQLLVFFSCDTDGNSAFHFVKLLKENQPASDQKCYVKSFLKLSEGASVIFLL